jgi:peptidoglycan/xylan/chitin deacetylase (PgdA/CDA1 family)
MAHDAVHDLLPGTGGIALKRLLKRLLLSAGVPDALRRRRASSRDGNCVYFLFGHRVTAPGDERGIPADVLDGLLAYLESGFEVLAIGEAVERLGVAGRGSQPGVVLSFDDGYADNLHHLLPALRARQFPATVFVTSGPIGTRERLWFSEVRRCIRETTAPSVQAGFLSEPLPLGTPQQRELAAEAVVAHMKASVARPAEATAALREALDVPASPCDDAERMLTREELARLAADPLVTIGAHTVTHPVLARLSEEDAVREIEDSRVALAEIIGYEPAFLAYPNGQPGDFTPAIAGHLRSANWRGALTTVDEAARAGCDAFTIPRIPLGTGPVDRLAWSLLRAT